MKDAKEALYCMGQMADKCLTTLGALQKDYKKFVSLVEQMRKAQKRQEYVDGSLDREAMYECRKLTKQRESEVDEYLKKMEECHGVESNLSSLAKPCPNFAPKDNEV